jgi:cysteine desulfurase
MLYLDNNATTQTDPRVIEKALPFLTTFYANASSLHAGGKAVRAAVKEARNAVAELIGADSEEIFFTSGATESINIILKSLAFASENRGHHIISCATEHAAVLSVCRYLEKIGFEITYLPVASNGLLDLNDLLSAIRDTTILISIMLVNNETGIIHDLKRIAEIANEKGIFLFSDATQAIGKIPVDVREIGVDFLSFSGHKFYAPKGIGGFYKKALQHDPRKKIKLESFMHGGGQEKGFRSGTLNTFGIVAIGEACLIAQKEMKSDAILISELRNHFENELLKISGISINGDRNQRIYNTTNIRFEGIDGNTLIASLPEIAFSSGSACASMKITPSHVLKAQGLSDKAVFESVRFSLGKFNTNSQIQDAITFIKTQIPLLRDV